MGRKHKSKKEGGEGETAGEQQKPHPDYVQPVDPPRAAVAVHPDGAAVAVACGLQLRVYDARFDSSMRHVMQGAPCFPLRRCGR